MVEKSGIRVVEKIGIRNDVATLDFVRLGLGRVGGPPLARFVNPQPGPDLTARIQDGDLTTNSDFFDHTNSAFFDHPTASVQAMAAQEGCRVGR